MIEVRHVEKRYGRVRALRGVSFDARAGQILGLLGPNGAGKTTTIRIITGYLPPTAGRVRVEGLDTLGDSVAVRRRLGHLPESTALYPEMRVIQHLVYRAKLYGVPRRARRSAIDRAIERCWLGDVRRTRVGHLSKGYKQRVGLAAAMLHDPPALVLDEPASGLDPAQIAQMRSLLRELATDKTVLLSSHILPEVELTCDRVVIIAHGRIRADSDIKELASRHARGAPYVAEMKGDPESVAARCRGVAGVAGVATEALDGGWARATATPAEDAPDLREGIAAAARAGGLPLRELRRDAPSLETIFVKLVSAPEDGEPDGDTES